MLSPSLRFKFVPKRRHKGVSHDTRVPQRPPNSPTLNLAVIIRSLHPLYISSCGVPVLKRRNHHPPPPGPQARWSHYHQQVPTCMVCWYRAQIHTPITAFIKNHREAENVCFENLPEHSNILIHETFLSCSNGPLGLPIVVVKFL